jgi:hypothetical protein
MTDTKVKDLDTEFSNLANTEKLVLKMEDKVNALAQKIEPR